MSTYEQIMTDLKQGKYAPMYMLCGEEPYYIDLVADYIEEHALDPMAREFDQTIVYGKDYERDMGPIVSAARRYPMMGQRQVIIVKEAQNIRSWEPLSLYTENIMPSTVLVFCYKYGKPDGRLSVFKNFEKLGGVMMESAKKKDKEMKQWLRTYISQWNKTHSKGDNPINISDQIVDLLFEYLGSDMQKVVIEIEKMMSGLPKGAQEITADTVERNIGISKDYNTFELQDAIINHDILKANRIARYFAGSKDHAIQKEIASLFSFFQNLMLFHYLPDKSQYAAAKALGVAPYTAQKLEIAARTYRAAKTMRIIGYIRDIDARSKGFDGADLTPEALWTELIFKILH